MASTCFALQVNGSANKLSISHNFGHLKTSLSDTVKVLNLLILWYFSSLVNFWWTSLEVVKNHYWFGWYLIISEACFERDAENVIESGYFQNHQKHFRENVGCICEFCISIHWSTVIPISGMSKRLIPGIIRDQYQSHYHIIVVLVIIGTMLIKLYQIECGRKTLPRLTKLEKLSRLFVLRGDFQWVFT